MHVCVCVWHLCSELSACVILKGYFVVIADGVVDVVNNADDEIYTHKYKCEFVCVWTGS